MGSEKFDKLNDSGNYDMWAYRMEMLLEKMDLWEMIDGSAQAPAAAPGSTAMRKWEKRKRLTKAEIVLKVEDSQLIHTKMDDPALIWTKLQTVHKSRGFATRMTLRRRFHAMAKQEEQTMQSYINQVQELAGKLTDLGSEISDEEAILVLTQGLPDTYDSLIVSLDATPPEALTVDGVIARLINEESRQEPAREKMKIEGAAFAVREVCSHCQRSGHGKDQCPLQKNKGKGKVNSSKVECWTCGGKGHMSNRCPNNEMEKANLTQEEEEQEFSNIAY